MSRYFGIGTGIGALALCLVLLGCGSGGVSHGAHSQVQEALDEALLAHEAEEAARQEAETEAASERAAREAADAEAASEKAARELAEVEAALAQVERELAEAEAAAAQTARQAAEADAAEQQRLADEAAAMAAAEEAAREEAEAQIQEAEEAAEAAQRSAREAEARAAEVERTREASQRAQYLQAELLTLPDGDPDDLELGSDIDMDVPSRGRLVITRPGGSWRMATLGGSGLRSTTMPLTSPVNTGKTVVYTDRELSRPLLEHFGHQRDPNNRNLLQFTASELTFSMTDDDGESTDGMVATGVAEATAWQLTLPRSSNLSIGIPKLVPGESDGMTPPTYSEPTDLESPRMAASYPLSLYGMSGQVVCSGGCEVTLTPMYGDLDENNRYPLESVTIGSSRTGGSITDLRFDPSGSPSVHFYNDGDFLGDHEYMVFGYWREDPRSPASPYDDGAIGVFAEVFETEETRYASLDPPDPMNATYRGTAVGMYVEQELADPIDTHRQGEFVASAILTVNGAPGSITGTIRDFNVTPTAGSAMPDRYGRWVVRLQTGNAVVLNNESGSTVGDWRHDYVQAHAFTGQHSDEVLADRSIPPGVTGIFNARIGTIARTDEHTDGIDMDALHIIGAFGAHR